MSPRAFSSPPPHLGPHQTAINHAYRHAFRLPPWAHTAFLQSALQQSGPGTPLLAYRALAPGLLGPQHPRGGRNGVSHLPPPTHSLAPLDVSVHPLPSPNVRPAPQHHTGSLASLRSLPYVVVACDGIQEGTRLGAGFLIWHPHHGMLYRGWLGLQAPAGHSTDAKWIAQIAAMFALRGWSGEALFGSHCTVSQLCDLPRGPAPNSALSIPYRPALLSATLRMHDA